MRLVTVLPPKKPMWMVTYNKDTDELKAVPVEAVAYWETEEFNTSSQDVYGRCMGLDEKGYVVPFFYFGVVTNPRLNRADWEDDIREFKTLQARLKALP